MTRKPTPPHGVPAQPGAPPTPQATHAMRRGGARREVSARVSLKPLEGESPALEGWALNVSRGGIRAIVEEAKVTLGEEFEITVGDGDELPTRPGRIVWLQEEPDGFIVGIEFTSLVNVSSPSVRNAQGASASAPCSRGVFLKTDTSPKYSPRSRWARW